MGQVYIFLKNVSVGSLFSNDGLVFSSLVFLMNGCLTLLYKLSSFGICESEFIEISKKLGAL